MLKDKLYFSPVYISFSESVLFDLIWNYFINIETEIVPWSIKL